MVPEGLSRPDIPELFSGGCPMCLCLRALLPTQCNCLKDGVTGGYSNDKGPFPVATTTDVTE